MKAGVVGTVAMFVAGGTVVHGQVDQCAELLRLSRTTLRTVVDRSVFTRTVDSFCDEAHRARRDSRSLDLDLRTLGIGQVGGSEADVGTAFTKYCSDESDERRDDMNYQQYLDGMDPQGFGAYESCRAAARNGVQFQLLPPTRDELQLFVSFPSNDLYGQARLSWDAIGPVTCQWESFDGGGEGTGRWRVLRADERTRLKCQRDAYDSEPINEPDYVNVIRDSGSATVNIPWQKYGPDNNPVPTLREIRRDLEAELAALGRRMTGLEERPDEIFGEWEQVEVGRVQRAESDGILVVTSGGNGAGAFTVQVGESDNRAEMQARTRGNAFQAASTPVNAGHYYHVARRGGRPGTIYAYWLPVGRWND